MNLRKGNCPRIVLLGIVCALALLPTLSINPSVASGDEPGDKRDYFFGYEKNGELVKLGTMGEYIKKPEHVQNVKPVLVLRHSKSGKEKRFGLANDVERDYSGQIFTAHYPYVVFQAGKPRINVFDINKKEVVISQPGRKIFMSPHGEFFFYAPPILKLKLNKAEEKLSMISLTKNKANYCEILSTDKLKEINKDFHIGSIVPWKWASDRYLWGVYNYHGGNKNFIYEMNIHSCDDFDVQLTDITDQVRERYVDVYSQPDEDMDFYQLNFEPERSFKFKDGRYHFLGGIVGRGYMSHMFYTKDLAEIWREYNQHFYWLYGSGLAVLGVLLIVSFWYPLWLALGVLVVTYLATILWINYAFVTIYSNWGGPVRNWLLEQLINLPG